MPRSLRLLAKKIIFSSASECSHSVKGAVLGVYAGCVTDTEPLGAATHKRGDAGGDRQSNEDGAAAALTDRS